MYKAQQDPDPRDSQAVLVLRQKLDQLIRVNAPW